MQGTPRNRHRIRGWRLERQAPVMKKSRRANIDAMLRHLAAHHDPHDFPSTAYERQALIEAAGKRRLIEWQKERRRYELTPIGVRRMRRGGGLGLPSLATGAGIGAAIGAAVLAMLWLPGNRSAGEHAAAGAAVKNIGAPGAMPDAPASAVPVTTTSAAAAPAEPAMETEPIAPTEPGAEPKPAGAKEPAGKKSRHRTARTFGRRNWTFSQRYRDERYAGSGRQ
jgi:hypothetical protein